MQEEIFPLVDEIGNVIGQAPRSVCHDGTMLLHPVIHLHGQLRQGHAVVRQGVAVDGSRGLRQYPANAHRAS